MVKKVENCQVFVPSSLGECWVKIPVNCCFSLPFRKAHTLRRLQGPLAIARLVLEFDICSSFDEALHLRCIALLGRSVQG